MIFVDSNIVIDLVEDGEWTEWSKRTLASQRRVPLVTNLVVVAEVSRTFSTAEDVLVFLRELNVALTPLTAEAAFRAGRAQVEYRQSGGPQRAILADFLIGAHASTLGATLATRDRGRFAAYFSELKLMTPGIENG